MKSRDCNTDRGLSARVHICFSAPSLSGWKLCMSAPGGTPSITTTGNSCPFTYLSTRSKDSGVKQLWYVNWEWISVVAPKLARPLRKVKPLDQDRIASHKAELLVTIASYGKVALRSRFVQPVRDHLLSWRIEARISPVAGWG